MKSFPAYLLVYVVCLNIPALAGDLGDYLPHDKAKGHFMRVVYPPRAVELFRKMQASLARNPDWVSAAVKANKPGEPLPYDEKLGLTPEEYKDYLALNKQATLKEILVRDIRVIRNADNTISLDAGEDLKPLRELRFDPARNVISTPYGDLERPRAVDHSGKDAGSVFGPYTGLFLGMEGGDENSSIEIPSGRTLSITLGKLTGSDKHFIFYNVMVLENGRRTTGIDMILEY